MPKGGQNFMKLYSVLLQINFLIHFLILQSLFLNAAPKYFKLQTFQKFQTMYQAGHVF